MDTSIDYGIQLKDLISKNVDVTEIGKKAYSVYVDLPANADSKFLDLLLTLGMMELGEEFAFSYEELEQIAGDLIAGKEVNL
jgi:hypothetical protein